MSHDPDGLTAELNHWCEQHPSFQVAETGTVNSVLLRLAPPAHADDIADEVYEQLAADVHPPHGVVLEHVVLDDRPALRVTLGDPSIDVEILRSVIDEIGADSERLIALWHPELPENGA